MVRVPTMGIIKCQEFIGEKAVAVTLSLVTGGGVDHLRHIPTSSSVWDHKSGREREAF